LHRCLFAILPHFTVPLRMPSLSCPPPRPGTPPPPRA
jgi:hypothetical protein